MDLAGCEYVVFKSAIKRYRAAGIEPDIAIPVISASGEGLCRTADRIDWYSGPTLQHWLGGLSAQASS
jgi:sulfate adenylyltransferase subunit 1 (EFTu-like GTPase family)